jgi:hypothetical protein
MNPPQGGWPHVPAVGDMGYDNPQSVLTIAQQSRIPLAIVVGSGQSEALWRVAPVPKIIFNHAAVPPVPRFWGPGR